MKAKFTLIFFGLAALAVFAVFFFISNNSNDSSGSTLPLEKYTQSPKSFAGNTYDIVAGIDTQLAYKENVARIFRVKLDGENFLPILVPAAIENFSPHTGQRYKFSVKVDGDGKLIVSKFRKL